MRVLITVPRLDLPGGVSNYYRTLRKHLDDHKVYFQVGAVAGESGRWTTIKRLMSDYRRFHRELGRASFDLVHINPSMNLYSIVRDGLFLLIARAHGCPVLVFYHGWNPSAEATIRGRFRRIFRFVYGKARANVVLANEFREVLKALGAREPFFVETMIVDDAVFDKIEAKKPAENVPGSYEVLYLGRLDTDKGLPEAIQTFECLKAVWPAASLIIAGDGPERGSAESEVRCRALRDVTFLGHVDGAARDRAYREADVYLFTSLAEGMPNSVLEAMAFGLPVVTRAVGGIRDFFENGRMGYSTDSPDPAVYAQLLKDLAENPALRVEIGRFNRDFARRRFSASVVSGRLLSVYEQVVGDSRIAHQAVIGRERK